MIHRVRPSRVVAKALRHMKMAYWRFRNPWPALLLDGASMAAEAQQVIWLRLWKLGFGTGDVGRELWLMTSEKAVAFVQAHVSGASALIKGRKDHIAARQAMAVYRKRVRANLRRLRRRRLRLFR
jgi:hypothetical protein